MRPTFHPRPVNNPFGDPCLFIPFIFEKRALLFDLGDLGPLTSRELLKLTHIFVTHTHMDHFIGFDTVLRRFLGRNKCLRLFGPPSFLRHVEGKLAGYTWNLVQNYTYPFSVEATEVHPDRIITQNYRCADGFIAKAKAEERPFQGTLVSEDAFCVMAIHLDHGMPCLAFKLNERFHVNILKDRLDALALPVGPWLNRFKEALYRQQDPDSAFVVSWKENGRRRSRDFRLGDLIRTIALISPGQVIVYIVDAVYSPDNAHKIISFTQGADQLFIEGAFLDEDKDTAQKKHHLTARQAGMLAGMAGVKNFTLMHHSPKYQHCADRLLKEAQEAYLTSPLRGREV